jgi:serologically defined colon cancer antigen 8
MSNAESGMDAPPDKAWLYSIGKQMVSLTKTVFQLHCQTVDGKDLIEDLIDRFESEIQEESLQIAATLEQTQSDLRQSTDAADAAIREMYDEKIVRIHENFENAKTAFQAYTKRIVDRANHQLGSVRTEMAELTTRSNTQNALFQEAKAEIFRLSTTFLENVGAEHRSQIRKRVIDANTKYNDGVIAAAKREQALKIQYESEISELTQMLGRGQKLAGDDLIHQQRDLESVFSFVEGEKDALLKVIDRLKEHIEQHQIEAEKVLRRAAAARDTLAESHRARLRGLEDQLGQRRKFYEEARAAVEADLARDEAAHNREVADMKARIAREKAFRDQQLEALESASNTDPVAADSVQSAVTELNAFLVDARRREQQLQAALESLERQNHFNADDLDAEASAEQRAFDENMRELRESHELEMERLRSAHEAETARLEAELGPNTYATASLDEMVEKAGQVRHELEIVKRRAAGEREAQKREARQLAQEHEDRVASLKQAHEQRMTQAEREIAAEMAALRSEHESAVAQLRLEGGRQLAAEKTALRQKLETQRQQAVQKMREGWEAKLADLRETLAEKQAEKERVTAYIAEETAKRGLETQIARDEIRALEAEWEKERQQITEEWEHQITSLREQRAIAVLAAQNAKKMREERRARALEQAQRELEDELAQKKQRIADLTRVLEVFRASAESTGSVDMQALITQRARREERLQFAVERLRTDTQARLREIAERRQEQGEMLAKQLQQARELGQRELDQLKQDFRAAKRARNQQLEALKQTIRKEDEAGTAELMELREKYDEELRELDGQQRAELAKLGEAVEAVKREREQLLAQHARRMTQQQKDYEARMGDIRKAFEEDNGEGDRNIEEVQEEKEKIIAELEAEAMMWEEKYRNRDARPEDLERIAHLEELIRVRAEAAAKIREEIRKYEPQVTKMRRFASKAMCSSLLKGDATAPPPPSPSPSKLPPLLRPKSG